MVIWILDCSTGYCTKVRLSEERQNELEQKFDDNVEDFLYEHEGELGINMPYSSWMASDDSLFDDRKF